MKLSDIILKEQNCGCGQTPCKTYGLNEELGVSRRKLSDFYVKVGGRNFAAAIIDIADENVLDDVVDALNFREEDGVSYYGIEESRSLSEPSDEMEKVIDSGIRISGDIDNIKDVMYYVHNNWMGNEISAEEAMKKISKYIS